MAHVGNGVLSHFWVGGRDYVITISWKEPLRSSGDEQPNAGQQQQGTASLVEHCIEVLMLVFGPAQQKTAPCESASLDVQEQSSK